MPSPSDRRYTDSHEWHKLTGETLTLGLTKHAVEELTDITYVEMKPAGTEIEPGSEVGEVESVKATSEVYCAVGGEIIEINDKLMDDPSLLNNDPYEEGWLVRLRVTDASTLDELMSGEAYDERYG